MKSIRKAIASLLAAAALTSAIPAFAAIPEDVAGTRYEEPVQVLSALGIMVGDKDTGLYRPDDTIIRSEVAKMAVHALGLEDVAASSGQSTKFPDVVDGHWATGYINVATSQGIVIGDENGNFRPDDKITYAEAMTIFVRVLGFEPVAPSKGGFPSGYIVLGSESGLNKNVTGSANDPISRGNVAYMTYNALTAKLMEQTGFGNDISYEVVDKTLLELIAKHKNNINPAFCSIIVDRFSSEDKNHTENLLRKYVVLFTHIKTEGYLYTLLKTLVERNMLSEAWMVYVDSLDYQIVIKEGFSFKSEGIALDYVPKWLLRDTLINHFWDNTFKKQVIEAEYTVAKLTLMMQRLTNELQTLKGKENDYHLDFLDIEKSVWRDNDDALITICDILRAALFKTSEEDMGSLNEWIRRAFERKESILRRIALLALRDNKKIDASEKVKVVLNKYDLFDLREQEQLFKLLASCFDGASTDLQQTVLDKIWNADLKAEDHYDERTSYYSKYNWYIWLKSQCSSRKEQIEYYLNKIRKIYPDFLPREHPELSSGPVETKWGSESPVSREELYKKSQEDLYCFIKDYHEDNFTTGADRQGLLHMVTDVCSDDFVWALKILRKQIMENDYTTDVWGAVLRGVSRAIKSIEDFIAILDIFEEIECFNLAKDFAGLIEYVLQRSDLKDLLRANETVKAQTFKCLRKLWLQKEERERFKADWPTISLNTTAGIVAHSFVMLACDVKNQQLDVVLKELVADGTLGVTEVPEFICTICEYSAQIYYIDPNWFNEHVIIMLESETLENKVAAWEGLLIGLRTINPALAEVLLPVFTRNRKIRKSLSKDYRNRFIHDYTLIFTYIEDNPIIEHLNPLLDTTEDKILLAKAIKSVLRSMDAKTVSDVWKKWLKQYCQLRLDNIPSAITTDELSEMISWVFIIPETEEIVDVILSIKVEGTIRAELSLFDFGESDIIINHPNEAAKLLVYIYNNCNKAVISKHQIREIANKIISNNVGGDLRERLEEMLA